ncbi:MAG: AraC family transcriptional regulator [Caldilinea sp. CFX5]|nr:AraC family transcriptional regulator [Caldilinea sp. CFX5]
MYAQSREALPSLSDGRSRTQPSLQLLLSSAQAGWPNLLVHHYRFAAAQTPLYLPARAEDMILLPLHDTGKLSGKVGSPFAWPRVHPGQLFLIPQQLPSEWYWTAPWEALALYLAPTWLLTVAAEVGVDAQSVKLIPRSGVVDAFLHQLGLALLTELKNGGIAGQRYVATLTHTLALHLLRNHALLQRAPATCTAGLAPQTLRKVLDYIEDHLPQSLTQAEVAAIAHVSPFHFARLFKQATGQSLHQYILSRRIAAAQRLLLAGRLTLADIALQVGFTDQSHLTRHFKRQCGMTPKLFAQERTNVQRERTIVLESGDGSG